MASKSVKQDPSKLRSRQWFDNPDNPDMTALYLERYMNYGLTREELQSGKPIIGIAQSGSDLSPCNRHHLELAERVREGIREAGGIAFEFPVHPIQETGKRPTAALDRNLAYLGLVEILYGYPSTASCSPPAATRPRRRSSWPRPPSTSRPSCCPAARCSTAGTAASAPARAPSSGRRASCWPRARSTTRNSSSSSPPRRRRPATATPWARPRP